MLSEMLKGLSDSHHSHGPRYPKDQSYIYRQDVFGEIMRRECARVDRTGHGFSFVVLQLPDSDVALANRVVDSVGERLRVTDLAGWLKTDQTLGIVLYACVPDAARGFIDRLCHAVDSDGLQCSIYSYPGDFPVDLFEWQKPGEISGKTGQNDDELATLYEFREELQRVQARIERTNGFFSIIIFDVRGSDNHGLVEELVDTLVNRIRASDFMGWFDHNSIGVILDGCLVCSALNFGNLICRQIAGRRSPPRRVLIQSFPTEWKSEKELEYTECNSCSDGELAEGITVQSCPSLCVQKSAFIPTSITVEYGAVIGAEMRTPAGAGLPLWKRLMDIFVALMVLILLSPILAVVAFIILVTSPGGVIYRQERVGYLGHPFVLYKFRSMSVGKSSAEHEKLMKHLIADAGGEDEPMLKEKANPGVRTTGIGKFIRATSLDEIPQLVNVLKGEMSLVGPRPPIPYEVDVYKRWHGGRFDSVPGLTGLWQVSGKNRLSFKEMARLDIQYSRNLSFWNDIRILLKTPGVIVHEFFASIGKTDHPPDVD